MPGGGCSPPCRGWRWPAAFHIERPCPRGRANFRSSPYFSRSVKRCRDVPRPCVRGQVAAIFLTAACGDDVALLLALRAPEGRAAVLVEAPHSAAAAGGAALFAFAVVDPEGMLEIAEFA